MSKLHELLENLRGVGLAEAWEYLTYACGHKGREQFYGPSRDRERKKEWTEQNKLCPECYAKKVQQQRSSETTAAKGHAGQAGLPELSGSAKQVDWAERIRHQKINEVNKFAEEELGNVAKLIAKSPERHGEGKAFQEAMDDAVKMFEKLVHSQTKASWWIDHREERPIGLFKLAGVKP